MSHAAVTPVKMRDHSDALSTDVLRVIGYRATCQCGWIGTVRKTVAIARIDVTEHRCEPAA